MNDFQNELQMLNVGDFQATQATPWDQNQFYMDQNQYNTNQDRQFGFGFGRCFSCFRCFNCFFNCFNCFRCHNCFSCARCSSCARCGHREDI